MDCTLIAVAALGFSSHTLYQNTQRSAFIFSSHSGNWLLRRRLALPAKAEIFIRAWDSRY